MPQRKRAAVVHCCQSATLSARYARYAMPPLPCRAIAPFFAADTPRYFLAAAALRRYFAIR